MGESCPLGSPCCDITQILSNSQHRCVYTSRSSTTGIFALIEPSRLGDIISLVGAVASTALALIFPPIIHILVFICGSTHHSHDCGTLDLQQQERVEGSLATSEAHLLPREAPPPPLNGACSIRAILTTTKNVAIILLGVVGGIVGTYAAVSDLAQSVANFSATCH